MASKQGQVEVVGLVVIVVFLLVLGLFFLALTLRGSDDGLSEVRSSTISKQFLSAVLKTTTPQGSYQDLVVSCSFGTCTSLEEETVLLLRLFFPDQKYTLTFQRQEEIFFTLSKGEGCGIGIQQNTKFKKDATLYSLSLKLC